VHAHAMASSAASADTYPSVSRVRKWRGRTRTSGFVPFSQYEAYASDGM